MGEPKKANDLSEYGGLEMILKVNKVFYDKVYEHPWISQFFKEIPQEHIEKQQADFVFDALGGEPKRFSGRLPKDAHMHIMINEELFELRGVLLREALVEAGANSELNLRWNKIDDAFKNVLLKKSPSECEKRYFTDIILDFPNPLKKSA